MFNRVTLIGNLGSNPEIRSTAGGKEVASFSLATSETWKKDGERQSRTEWHKVVIFSEGLVSLAKNYLNKGSKVFLEGQMKTRKWTDQSGTEKYSTEIVLQGYSASLIMLDAKGAGERSGGDDEYAPNTRSKGGSAAHSSPAAELDDEIPF